MSASAPDTTTDQAAALARALLSVVAQTLGQDMMNAIVGLATGENLGQMAIDDVSTLALSIVRAALDVLEPQEVKMIVTAAWATADAQADTLEDLKFPKGRD